MIGPTSPRLRRSPSIASATPGRWTLTATAPVVRRARWTWPSEASANGSSSKSENSSGRARRARARRRAERGRTGPPPGPLAARRARLGSARARRRASRGTARAWPPRPSSAELRPELLDQGEACARATRSARRHRPRLAAARAGASPADGVDPRGLGGVDEVAQNAHEAQRVVEMREVPRGGEDLQPAARDQPWAARPCSAGMIGSRSPQMMRNGIDSAR